MNKALIFSIAVTLAGCSSSPSVNYSKVSPESVAAATVVSGSTTDEAVQVVAPTIEDANTPGVSYSLRGTQTPGAKTVHQLYVVVSYRDARWHLYDSASLPGGQSEPTMVMDREEGMCTPRRDLCNFREAMGIPLSEAQLRQPGALEVRINSNLAQGFVISVPRNYIDGYLLAAGR